MTKPLTAAQKAANKRARAASRLTPKDFNKAKAQQKAAPTKTRREKLLASDAKKIAAMQARETPVPTNSGTAPKLDMETREQPLKGVRGRVAPKPAPARATRSKSESAPAAPRELKYVDAGEGHPHRFSGRNWDGTLYRSANGTLGLERSTDEGATWERYLSDEEFVSRDRWDLGRAIQRSTKEKSHDIRPRRVAGAVAAKPARATRKHKEGIEVDKDLASAPRKARASKAAPTEDGASDAVQSEELRTVWKRREPVTTCEWGHGDIMKGQKPCTATSTRRVVCNSGRNFVDVCDRHEKAYLTTKSSRWVGCTSYALTPTGPRTDGATSKNETPAEQAVKV